jgi:hypothetical protein
MQTDVSIAAALLRAEQGFLERPPSSECITQTRGVVAPVGCTPACRAFVSLKRLESKPPVRCLECIRAGLVDAHPRLKPVLGCDFALVGRCALEMLGVLHHNVPFADLIGDRDALGRHHSLVRHGPPFVNVEWKLSPSHATRSCLWLPGSPGFTPRSGRRPATSELDRGAAALCVSGLPSRPPARRILSCTTHSR